MKKKLMSISGKVGINLNEAIKKEADKLSRTKQKHIERTLADAHGFNLAMDKRLRK